MENAKAVHLTAENFNTTIGSGVTLVDFWAPWCGPCRAVGPIIEELASEYSGRVTIAKVNVDDEGSLAATYRVMSIPTVGIFKDGKLMTSAVGLRPKADYKTMIDKFL